MMSGQFWIFIFILLYALSFSSAHYRPGLRELADRIGHPDGDRRLRDELCDEIERRHPLDDYWRREARRIRHEPVNRIINDLGDLMDSLERKSPAEAERIFRDTVAKMKLTAPRKYWMLNGTWTPDWADRKCKERGGQLAIIRNGIEQTLAWEATSRWNGYKNEVYFGLEKINKNMRWRDETPVTWHRVENSRRVYSTKRCGVIDIEHGEMHLMRCTIQRPALCESPATSRPPTTSVPAETKPVRPHVETEIRFTFDYDNVMKYPTFKTDLIQAIEELLKKQPGDVKILDVRRGSTIVRVRVYLKSGEDPEMITSSLHNEAKSTGKLYGRFYGLLVPIVDPYPEPYPDASNNILKILVPVAICLLVVTAVVIVLAFCMIKRRKTIQPRPNVPVSVIKDELPTYKEFTENDYTKPPSVTEPNAPPGYDDCFKAPIA